MAAENQQLRSMLQSLLLATEAAGNLQSVEIMRQMDSKLTAIVEAAGSMVVPEVPEALAPEAVEAAETVEVAETPVVAEVPEALALPQRAPERSRRDVSRSPRRVDLLTDA